VFDNLVQRCEPMDHILPMNERQARSMNKLEPQQQWEVWQTAVQQALFQEPTTDSVGRSCIGFQVKPEKFCTRLLIDTIFEYRKLDRVNKHY
jgi:hypothetical protein